MWNTLIIVTFHCFLTTISSISSINCRCMRDLRRYPVNKSAFIPPALLRSQRLSAVHYIFNWPEELCKTDTLAPEWTVNPIGFGWDCNARYQRAVFILQFNEKDAKKVSAISSRLSRVSTPSHWYICKKSQFVAVRRISKWPTVTFIAHRITHFNNYEIRCCNEMSLPETSGGHDHTDIQQESTLRVQISCRLG